MDPVCVKLNLYRGDTWRAQLRLWTDAARTVPFDLTGYTADSHIRIAPGATGPPLMVMDCQIGVPNTIDLTLSAAQWDDWTAGQHSGAWDVQIMSVDGDVTTMIYGDVTIRDDVTYPGAT